MIPDQQDGEAVGFKRPVLVLAPVWVVGARVAAAVTRSAALFLFTWRMMVVIASKGSAAIRSVVNQV